MAYPTTELILDYLCFSPEKGATLSEKLTDCYSQFTDRLQNKCCTKGSVIKQTVFISVADESEYFQSKQKLLACANVFFGDMPPTSIIAQSPASESLVVEFMYIRGIRPNELFHRKNGETSWLVFQRGDIKMVITAGFSEYTGPDDILNQSNSAFSKLQSVLLAEGMEFSDIVRQWNYIEQITMTVDHNNSTSQHYQIFNDVRSKYYQQADFKNGYPAATGIGADFGGVIIEMIAVKLGNNCSVVSVKSPVQLDAYSYSAEVLAENNSMKEFCRTTPKFERAKIMATPENKWIFISGTAAIVGQSSILQRSVEQQTEMTIQNILKLISTENLEKHGINPGEKASITYLRVYVKYKEDMEKTQEICLKYFTGTLMIFAVADICRPELLVEIEGQAVIH